MTPRPSRALLIVEWKDQSGIQISDHTEVHTIFFKVYISRGFFADLIVKFKMICKFRKKSLSTFYN